ncbi:Hypp7154 [Branchiostoma lanceolatum]|uniref:Hypp7154 protein n=1 Tax=Branchiostoma lanceolatum TaxID=7740 RepID=A0A8K0E9X0_BRALA|nr:Hypp7154 [Branchiostoma lanceolatum]
MGTGASTAEGMPLSPRVEYAEQQGKKTNQTILIDNPKLVDLGHGSVRYRRPHNGTSADSSLPSGSSASKPVKRLKEGYFYHPQFKDYSEDAILDPKDAFKLQHVCRGPPRARGKKLFYVYGIGKNAKDPGLQRQGQKPQGKGYQWPQEYRNPSHAYFELTFVDQDDADNLTENDDDDDYDIDSLDDTSSENQDFMRNDDVLRELREQNENKPRKLTVELRAI